MTSLAYYITNELSLLQASLHQSVTPTHLPELLASLSRIISKHLPVTHLKPTQTSLLARGSLSLLRSTIGV